MNEATIKAVTAELRDNLVGRKFGKIFVIGDTKIAVDFRTDDGAYLLISADPVSPALYLAKRTVKELNALSGAPDNFAMFLRKKLSHATLEKVEKKDAERIVEFVFNAPDDIELASELVLVVQLTGRSSNVFLLDARRKILTSARRTFGTGQQTGDSYDFPVNKPNSESHDNTVFPSAGFKSVSEALDKHFQDNEQRDEIERLTQRARSSIKAKLKKARNLRRGLERDLANHGDPSEWKRLGDLLNSNISTARREGSRVFLTDYFDENLNEIELELDENTSLSEGAEEFFRRYSKSRTGRERIKERLQIVDGEIAALEKDFETVESAVEAGDIPTIESFLPKKQRVPNQKSSLKDDSISKYAREFDSSDGYRILVGKKSKDNDYLTFRIARSLDVWLHAADYPGSHVVIRRKGKTEIPESTVIEAAQLAAFYSKAKNEAKAAVRIAERKFVKKPKGAAPGLVSLANFRTLLVKPGIHIKKSGS